MGNRRRRANVVATGIVALAIGLAGVAAMAATGSTAPPTPHGDAAVAAPGEADGDLARRRISARRPALRIYPLGDSITFGATPVADTPGGYRGFMSAVLDQVGVAHEMVGTSVANPPRLRRAEIERHDGHNGYRIDQVLANLDGVAGAYDDHGGHWLMGTAERPPLHPDVVLVHLGTNDIWGRYDPANAYDDPEPFDEAAERTRFVQSMTSRLRLLVDRLHTLRPGATVVVATVIPISTGNPADVVPTEYARSVHAMVDDLRRAGRRVALADAHARYLSGGLPTPGLLSPDGIHPSEEGYAVLGEVFAEAVLLARGL